MGLTFQKAIPRESNRGRLLISSYFGDNFEIVSVVSKEIVCGCLFKYNYSTSLRVAPWQEYKLIGSVDKRCSFCLSNCTVKNNTNSPSS